jgi:hypothetical protein
MRTINRAGEKERRMKGLKFLTGLWALFAAGCALPLGEDYLITRDGGSITYITGYNLLDYVPVPKPGERPVTLADQGDLKIEAVWKDETGVAAPFGVFAANTVYRAEIKISVKPGYGFYPSAPFTYPPGKIKSQASDLGDPVRTITVTYHNSDEWDITYITDYNLQNYVPVPMAGEKPVRAHTPEGITVTAEWTEETNPGVYGTITGYADPDFSFLPRTVYRAEIELAAETGYRFSAVENFAYPNGVSAIPQGDGAAPAVRRFVAVYSATRTPTIINDRNLTPYVPKPVIGTAGLIVFAASQYTGTVTWKNTGTGEPLTGPFQPDTAYTAELALRPVSGYTVNGLGQDVFIHTGAGTVTNAADSGVITITFPATGSYGTPTVVYDTILTGRLPKPVSGMMPVTNISIPQYSGVVSWIPSHSAFQDGIAYQAILILNAAPGYTFNGIRQNAFTHGDAAGTVINQAGSGTVTISFPAAASSTYQVIASFGPVEDEDSALWMMKELKDDAYPLTIDLPDNAVEVLEPNMAVLAAEINSPTTVIINGHGGTLKINSPGTLLELGGGTTLTLQNITLEGRTDNHAPLVRVNGGRLVLGTGAVLTGNASTGNAGGVWVAGGTLVLNNGGTIRHMSAASPGGGGVLIDTGGTFHMDGGTIAYNSAAAGQSGGGLAIKSNGTVEMNSGIIEYNHVAAGQSGGGVYAAAGASFNHRGGVITNNTAADGTVSGSGVYLKDQSTNFTMTGTAQVAENNIVFLDSPADYYSYGAFIRLGDVLSSPIAANIIINGSPNNSTRLLVAPSITIMAANKDKFLYDGRLINLFIYNHVPFLVAYYDSLN